MKEWRRYLKEGDLEACRAQGTSFDEFINGVELAAMDPKIRKEKIEALKKSGERTEWLGNALTIAGLLSAIPGLQVAGVAAGAMGAIGVLGQIFQARQERATDKNVDQLLKVLCIDEDLLDTIQNSIESAYWTSSDLKDQLADYISVTRANPSQDPMPDFTEHFVDWLNTHAASPYSDSDDTKIVQGT